MPKRRKADPLAGRGSLAGRLKRRRQLMEAGMEQEARKPMMKKKKKKGQAVPSSHFLSPVR